MEVVQTYHTEGSINFTDVRKVEKPERYLLDAQEILDKYCLKWFLAFGTALGFYRDKDFIPGDSDIDIVILADGYNCDGFIKDLNAKYRIIRVVRNEERIHQVCFQGDDNFIIDVCFYYRDNEEYYTIAGDNKQFRDSVDVIGDITAIKTKYGSFPFPERMPDYLKARYGDWQTPKYGALTSSIKVCE
jgi:hypothetical protein